MTPTTLRRALRDHPATADIADEIDPSRLVRALERRVVEAPTDRALARLLTDAIDFATAGDDLPPLVAGVRPGPVVRWSSWSVTFEGVDVSSGQTVLARTLRAGRRSPPWRKALARDARLLAGLHGARVTLRDEPLPVLMCPVPGEPLLDEAPLPEDLATRAVLRIAGDLAAWENAGLPLPDPDGREIRQASNGAALLVLDPDGDDLADLGDLAVRLSTVGPGPHDPVLDACARFAPGSASEFAELLTARLAERLAEERHTLARAWHDRRHHHQVARLKGLVARLGRVGPPIGRGALGVDLEGRPTVLESEGTTLTWGPVDGPTLAVLSEQGLHARTARRLLRTRAQAIPNPRLDEMVGGEPGYADRACRWVASALELRTVQKLLEIPP